MRQTLADFYALSPPQSSWSNGRQHQHNSRLPRIPAKSSVTDSEKNCASLSTTVSTPANHFHPELFPDNHSCGTDTLSGNQSSGNNYTAYPPATLGCPRSRRARRNPQERPQRNVTLCFPLMTRPFQFSSFSTDRCILPTKRSVNRELGHAVFPELLEQSLRLIPASEVSDVRRSVLGINVANDPCPKRVSGQATRVVSLEKGLNPRVKRNLPALVALERSQSIYICNLSWRGTNTKQRQTNE